MTAESIKKEIAETFLIALRLPRLGSMRTIMAPDVVWSLPGLKPNFRGSHGVDAVIARCQLITSYGLNFGLKHVLYGQFGFALSLHTRQNDGDLFLMSIWRLWVLCAKTR